MKERVLAMPRGGIVRNTNRIIIAGHSHVVAFGVSAKAGPPELCPLQTSPRLWGLKGQFPREAEYWDALVKHAHRGAIALVWGGNEHFSLFLFEEVPFDFVLREKEWLPLTDGAYVVPELLIREKFRQVVALSSLNGLIGALKATAPDSCIALVGTPPPKPDNSLLPQLFQNEFHKELSKFRLTPQLVRLKLWCVLRDVYREVAEQNHIAYIEVPKELKDDIGFLKQEYWENDMTHANARYGAFVQSVLIERL
jgi:hypothetical protein